MSLFPDGLRAFLDEGLIGKAQEDGLVEVHYTDPRDFTRDRHRSVDDAPFGGGAGMLMQAGPVVEALEYVEARRGPCLKVLVTPSAPPFRQSDARELATFDRIAVLCGRYEGIDDRVREHYCDRVYSVGEVVLNGGEVAALAIVEAVSRLRPGVLGNPESVEHESFSTKGGLEHPQYTRPASFRGHAVPSVLLGGDHAAIRQWRAHESWRRTWELRPELGAARPQLRPRGLVLWTQSAISLKEAKRGDDRRQVPLLGARDRREARRKLRKLYPGTTPVFLGLGNASGAPTAVSGQVISLLDAQGPLGSWGEEPEPVIVLVTPEVLGSEKPHAWTGGTDPEKRALEWVIGLAPHPMMIDPSQPLTDPPEGPQESLRQLLEHLAEEES